MKTLREEIIQILAVVGGKKTYAEMTGLSKEEVKKELEKHTDQILELIASRLPEKIDPQQFQSSLSGPSIFPAKYTGFNEVITGVKSILKGGV